MGLTVTMSMNKKKQFEVKSNFLIAYTGIASHQLNLLSGPFLLGILSSLTVGI